ncbi:MAG TPA: alpha/beta hydrolase [Miltoncostaea sp.]|nr:alpha/beta hydrolase [Miltoncostaea sp.]
MTDIGLAHLHPEGAADHLEGVRAFNAAKRAAGGQRGPADLDELRRARAGVPSADPGSRAVARVVRADGREVGVRVTTPATGAPRAAHLEIHGGGFYLGSAEAGDARNARLADALGVAVVGVEYRLAPEHPWPAAPDDCETAARWLLGPGMAELGATRMTIGGASAGATLAVATLLRLRDGGGLGRVAGTVLRFGAYDLSGRSPGGRRYADEWFIQAYAGHVADRTIPDVSPLYGDLRGLPPTLMLVGTLDVLLDDNLAMAARLSGAGTDVDLRVYPEALHGFTSHPTTMAAFAMDGIAAWLRDRLRDEPPDGGGRGGGRTR